MATNAELKMVQKDKLYDLLKLKYDNADSNINGLDDLINKTEAIMEEEDVAWVEKKIAQRKK
ncbi:MAG: hypothetical protein FWD03_08900 [Defluviitaleaceae bacterium]|nr:hypothetical protein [Defluviitaleaceae bacterium]